MWTWIYLAKLFPGFKHISQNATNEQSKEEEEEHAGDNMKNNAAV
jgi:hypothetical protein